jgi:uncharacterized protein
MQLSEESNSAKFQIRQYAAGEIWVNAERYTTPLCVAPSFCVSWRPYDFELMVIKKPKVVLIGTGAQHQVLSPTLLAPLIQARIGFEVMSTPAACRTYALLSADNRDIIALLCL